MNKRNLVQLPPEFAPHKGTIVMIPYRNDIWRDNARYAQQIVWEIVNIISNHEKVYLCYNDELPFKTHQFNTNVELLKIPYDDIWARDISPFFIKKGKTVHGISFGFNAWGGIEEGSYYPWDNDAMFSRNFCKQLKINCTHIETILEGGAIANNGRGVLIVTESVLLNPNRNTNTSKTEYENMFKFLLGIEKVIWLKNGFQFDETNGHIDVFLNFIDDQNLFLAWTDDERHPQFSTIKETFDVLKKECTLDGKPFIIHKLPIPDPLYITENEANGIVKHDHALERNIGFALYPTYNNAYIFNGGVLVPIFNAPEDSYAIEAYQNAFQDRKVYPIYSKEILIGGGNFHCILHEVPEV